ncbi:hypothetical protein NEFER03_0506 [Nematocida sp. LUAm3]|nr:hypothetical protein NEFER03_0506 [Nematocida sp. LUAm3]KAI5175473.1 hypothetical protein NEFER02_1379 [Nematocida sp. LUAm2]KAI5178497.1 hypothetical protein NEFER01_1644 [Nematocida sp. LUAm1]
MLKMRKYQGNVFLGLIILFMCFSSFRTAASPLLVVDGEEEEETIKLVPIINNEEVLSSSSQKNIKLSDVTSPHKPSSILGKRLSSNNAYPKQTKLYDLLSIDIDGSTSGIDPSAASTDVPTCSTNNIQETDPQSAFTPYSLTSGMPSSSSQSSIQIQDVSNTPSCSSVSSLPSAPITNIRGSSLQTDVSKRHEFSSLSTRTIFKKILLLGSNDELELIRMGQKKNSEESSYTVFYNMPAQEEFLPILNQHKFVVIYVSLSKLREGLSMLLQIIRKNQNSALNLMFEWVDFTNLHTMQESSITKHPSEYLQKFSLSTYIEPFFMLINPYSNFIADSMQVVSSITNRLYKGYDNMWYNAVYVLRNPIIEKKRVPENCFPCIFFNLLIYSNVEEVGIVSMDYENYTNIGLLTIPFLTSTSNLLHIKRIIILEPNINCLKVIKHPIKHCPEYIDVTYNHWKHIYKYLMVDSQGKDMQEIVIRNIYLYQLMTLITKNNRLSISLGESASMSSESSNRPKKTDSHYIYTQNLLLYLNPTTSFNMSKIVKTPSIFDSILNWLTKKNIYCARLQIEVNSKIWKKEKAVLSERVQSGDSSLFPISNFNRLFVPSKFDIVNEKNKKIITIQIEKPSLSSILNTNSKTASMDPINISMQVSE